LLHPDPEVRIASMRLVLEHPFFTGGNLPRNPDSNDATSPQTIDSTPSSRARPSTGTSRSSNSRTFANVHSGFPSRGYVQDSDPPVVGHSNSMESIENRENVRASRTSNKRSSDQNSPSDSSVRSGRSIGSGFRKLRSSLRRQNA
jgi:hypothetical protein